MKAAVVQQRKAQQHILQQSSCNSNASHSKAQEYLKNTDIPRIQKGKIGNISFIQKLRAMTF